MLLFPSRKKLVAERDRLQAETDAIAKRNAEDGLSADRQVQALLPLAKKKIEINNKILEMSSKSDLIAERNALQSQLDLQLQESKSLSGLSQETKMSVLRINGEISNLDYLIKSKSGFVNSIVRWVFIARNTFIILAGVVAIASIIYGVFQ